jgi:predicted dehydrogenase
MSQNTPDKQGGDSTAESSGANRRDFLKYSAFVAGYGVWAATGQRNVALAQQSANDKVNVAWVGVGGKGDSDSSQVTKFANLVAICDVDERNAKHKLDELEKKNLPKPKVFSDWRKMFDEMGKDIDACGVSIPDHNHAIVTMHAIKMKKHVYTQKPLTHTIAEARALREAAKEAGIVSQMGNQGTASQGLRSGVEAIRSGAIGNVKEVHIWTNRPIWPQAPELMNWPEGEEVPKWMNWDVWLGPATHDVKYSSKIAPFNWRGYWQFGTGAMGDMGCHTCNLPYMALNLDAPTRVQGVCADLNPVTYPAWATVHYDFPARGERPPVKVSWYEGHFGYIGMKKNNRTGKMEPDRLKNLPPMHLFQGASPSDSGSLTVGDKGTLYSPQDYGGSWELLPKEKYADWKHPEASLPRFESTRDDDNMKLEWISAIQGKGKTLSNFDYAGMLVEFILLGNVANRVPGQPLHWDTAQMKITNNEHANRFLQMPYRQGWSLT